MHVEDILNVNYIVLPLWYGSVIINIGKHIENGVLKIDKLEFTIITIDANNKAQNRRGVINYLLWYVLKIKCRLDGFICIVSGVDFFRYQCNLKYGSEIIYKIHKPDLSQTWYSFYSINTQDICRRQRQALIMCKRQIVKMYETDFLFL